MSICDFRPKSHFVDMEGDFDQEVYHIEGIDHLLAQEEHGEETSSSGAEALQAPSPEL